MERTAFWFESWNSRFTLRYENYFVKAKKELSRVHFHRILFYLLAQPTEISNFCKQIKILILHIFCFVHLQISNHLSKHLKLRGRSNRSSSITSLKDSLSKSSASKSLNEEDLLRETLSRPTTTATRVLTCTTRKTSANVELSKPEKVNHFIWLEVQTGKKGISYFEGTWALSKLRSKWFTWYGNFFYGYKPTVHDKTRQLGPGNARANFNAFFVK